MEKLTIEEFYIKYYLKDTTLTDRDREYFKLYRAAEESGKKLLLLKPRIWR